MLKKGESKLSKGKICFFLLCCCTKVLLQKGLLQKGLLYLESLAYVKEERKKSHFRNAQGGLVPATRGLFPRAPRAAQQPNCPNGGEVTEEMNAFPLSHFLIKTHRLAAR